MDNLIEITLISETSIIDDIGQETVTETESTVMGNIRYFIINNKIKVIFELHLLKSLN